VSTVYRDNFPFELGKAVTLVDGGDATIISTGMVLPDALEAADSLAKDGIKVRLLDMHTIKPLDEAAVIKAASEPLDEAAVIKAASETGAIVTVEDSNILGGLGGAVAEVTAENVPVPVRRVGVRDRFGQSGTVPELKEEYGLSAKYIAQAVKEEVKRK
jgi:transketolase